MTVYEILLNAFSPTIQFLTTLAIGWAAAKAVKLFTTWTDKLHNEKVRNFVKDHVWAMAQTQAGKLTGSEMKETVMMMVQKQFPKFPPALLEIFLESAVQGLKILKSPEIPILTASPKVELP